MNAQELSEAGRRMSAKQVTEGLRLLAQDPRFVVVVAWLERNEAEWTRVVSSQSLAPDHGKLAHAAGSLHGIQVLLAQIRQALDTKGKAAS